MSLEFNEEQLLAGRKLFSAPARFQQGVAHLDQLPAPRGIEIAFAGRSNVGKSSLINALTGVHDLARASNTPGRTRELNFFILNDQLTLVDMPGYGYAKAAKKEIKQWQALLKAYLRGRLALTRVFVLIDARHGVLEADKEMLALLDEAAVTYQLVLTKIDKINLIEREKVEAEIQTVARGRAAAFPIIHVTSSEKREGLEVLRAEIASLLT